MNAPPKPEAPAGGGEEATAASLQSTVDKSKAEGAPEHEGPAAGEAGAAGLAAAEEDELEETK